MTTNADGPFCGGARRQGEEGATCRRPAGWGTDHLGHGRCKLHGGATPTHQKAAQRSIAKRAVAEFAASREVEPHQALLEVLRLRAGMVAFLAAKIAGFEDDDELKQLSIGAGREKFERPSVWVEMYETALREYAKIAKACVDAGIDERRMQIEEGLARQFIAAVERIIDGLMAGLADVGVSPSIIEDFQRTHVPRIVREALASLAFTDSPDALPRGA